MSDDNKDVSAKADASEPNGSDTKDDIKPDSKSEVETTSNEQVNQRLLEESKKYKQRAIEAEKRLKEGEEKTLEEQQRFKELYEKRDQEYQKLKEQVAFQTVKTQVDNAAAKAGCIDTEALMKLGDMSLLQFDEDSGQVHGKELFIEDAKKKAAYLFRHESKANVPTIVPRGKPQQGSMSAKKLAKASTADRNKVLYQLYKQKQG